MKRCNWIFSLLLCGGMLACSPQPDNRVQETLHLAASAGEEADQVDAWIVDTAKGVGLETLAGGRFQETVWAELLSGSERWDAVLLDARWVGELAEYKAILRIAKYGGGTSNLRELTWGNEGEAYAIPYRIDIPVMIYKPGSAGEKITRKAVAELGLVTILERENLKIGFAGQGAGISNWLLSRYAVESDEIIAFGSGDSNLETAARLLCHPESQRVDTRSGGWNSQEVWRAVQSEELDAGVVWLTQLNEIAACTKTANNACPKQGELKVVPLFPTHSPRSVSAWVLPVRARRSQEAEQIVGGIPQSYGVEQTGFTAWEEISRAIKTSAPYSSDISGTQIDSLDRLVLDCLAGQTSSEKFLSEYLKITRK